MRRGSLFLFVVISALLLISTGDHTVLHNVHGIVGGSVRMHCELEHTYNINRLYFQRKDSKGDVIFINGFDSKALPDVAEYKNRTIVNKSDLSMEMFDLSPADEGPYTCIPFVNGQIRNQTKFQLTVTANHSVPVITLQGCNNGLAAHNCVIGCSSSGGFPRSNVTWDAVGDEMSSLLRDGGDPVFMQDTHSHLWNVSHTVTLNCSRRLNITCSVGGVVSPNVIVYFRVVIAFVVLLLVSIVLILTVIIKSRRTHPSAERSTDAELASLK